MRIIEPFAVTPAMMTATNVPENDRPAWVSGTTYAAGARVIRDNAIWESLQGSNTGNDPSADALSEWWFRVGATNRWRAFDSRLGGVTQMVGNITYSIVLPRTLNSVAFFGLDAQSVRLRIVAPGGSVLSNVLYELSTRDQVGNFWEYIFQPFDVRNDLILTGVNMPAGVTLEITIISSGAAAVGEIMIGNDIQIGTTLMESSLGIVDYSKKERDEFGGVFIVPRAVTKTVSFRFSVPTTGARRVQQIMERITSKVCIFYAIPGEDQFGMTVAGVLRDYDLTLSTSVSFGTIQAESLT
ncbi:MAG: hypothetical protein ACK4IA_16495 [Paracoccus hibiscisoli]|uniref:hypothetical protein n=1 Tax=Paracoccus hibiscisoli TaxID=2023261 RepID=UPI00391B2518